MLVNLLQLFVFIILILTTTADSRAGELYSAGNTDCELTPQIIELVPHLEVYATNNLRRFTGSPDVANGDPIIITGVLRDANCVPISDAVVKIWQVDSVGNKMMLSGTDKNYEFDQNFTGSGKSITDNMGRFKFLTVMPGSSDENSAPSVNFLVNHRDFLPFETKMYFENQNINSSDPILQKNVNVHIQDRLIAKTISTSPKNDEEITYSFNITLDGVNKYLQY